MALLTGLSNLYIPNPVATISATTTYIVTGTTATGCSAKDTLTISIWPKAAVTTSNGTAICGSACVVQLFN